MQIHPTLIMTILCTTSVFILGCNTYQNSEPKELKTIIETHYPINPLPAPSSSQLSWDEAIKYVHTGQVKRAAQTHDGMVSFLLKTGESFSAPSPRLDEIITIKKECGALCAKMDVFME